MKIKYINEDLVISLVDYQDYIIGGRNNRIFFILKEFTDKLPEVLQEEISKKQILLKKNEYIHEDSCAFYLTIGVKHASKKLRKEIFKHLPYLVCLK